MQSKTPDISVVLSVYNGERYVRDAVESILTQTFKNFELIIIDDGSSDGTAQILDTLKDPRILRIKNEKNLGLIRSLNKGIAAARGKFFARMDADDVSYPERFEAQLEYLEKHPGVGVLGTAVDHTDEKGRTISTLIQPSSNEGILWKMFFECAIIHPTVMIREDILRNAGGYDVNFPHIEDTELWMRIIPETKFANLPQPLVAHRLHGGSIGSTESAVQYRLGLTLRERFMRTMIGKRISTNVNRWFSANETVLSLGEIEEGIGLLFDIYECVTKEGFSSDDASDFVRKDFLRKAVLLADAGGKAVSKKAISVFKGVLPAPLRHKLRTKFGKYFGI